MSNHYSESDTMDRVRQENGGAMEYVVLDELMKTQKKGDSSKKRIYIRSK